MPARLAGTFASPQKIPGTCCVGGDSHEDFTLALFLLCHRAMQRHEIDVEQERALFTGWTETGLRGALSSLVRSQQPMITRWARRYASRECSLADLVQEGNVGLMYAIERFDPTRGVRLGTFSSWWVRAHMLRFMERNTRLVRGATTSARRRLFYQLAKTTAALSQDGSVPDSSEIADALGVSVADVEAMSSLRAPAASLDVPRCGDDSARMDRVCDPAPSPEDKLADAELAQRLHGALDDYAAELDGPALSMLRTRVASLSPTPLRDLGAQWGLSNAAVRRLEKRVCTPLRRHLYRSMGDAVVETLGIR
ncbi:MAG: sigma-70 family RNA polymerase sigma factor [Nannocystaceae bacterium]|nr:sigma-70 family RNA polymerase sigma factor [Nannocystaceae bacterium]